MKLLVVIGIVFTSFFNSYSVASTRYSILLEDSSSEVRKRFKCNSDIKNGGGDYYESGVRYSGKCEGGGIAPLIKTDSAGRRYLSFFTDSNYSGRMKTRTELALLGKWFEFKKPLFIAFSLMLPKSNPITNEFFYLMQFWQCPGKPPIAGVRVRRGKSHEINFMTRGDSREGSLANFTLEPDKWYSFVIKVIADPSGQVGTFTVWNSYGERNVTEFTGPFGYRNVTSCKGMNEFEHQRFRLKFGIYKGSEHGKSFEAGFDDIRIGESLSEVKL